MASIIVRLQNYEETGQAMKVADDIREAGEVRYTTGTGETETAYVADVTVEDGSAARRSPAGQGQSPEGQQGKTGQEEDPSTH